MQYASLSVHNIATHRSLLHSVSQNIKAKLIAAGHRTTHMTYMHVRATSCYQLQQHHLQVLLTEDTLNSRISSETLASNAVWHACSRLLSRRSTTATESSQPTDLAASH
jgi:hypothetical protein